MRKRTKKYRTTATTIQLGTNFIISNGGPLQIFGTSIPSYPHGNSTRKISKNCTTEEGIVEQLPLVRTLGKALPLIIQEIARASIPQSSHTGHHTGRRKIIEPTHTSVADMLEVAMLTMDSTPHKTFDACGKDHAQCHQST